MIQYIKFKILRWLTKDLLKTIDLSDILTIDKQTGTIFIDGVIATPDELRRLKAEAHEFKDMFLYQILINTPKRHAHQILFNKLQTMDDMWGGKMLLYLVDIQEKIVLKLS